MNKDNKHTHTNSGQIQINKSMKNTIMIEKHQIGTC